MFKLNKNSIHCDLFYVLPKDILIWERRNRQLKCYSKRTFNLNKTIEINKSIQFLYPFSEGYYAVNGDSELIKYDKNFNLIKQFNQIFAVQSIESFYDEKIICFRSDYTQLSPKFIGLFDLKAEQLKWEINLNFRYVFFEDDLLISDNFNDGIWGNICRINVINGNIMWEIKTDSIFERYIGRHMDIIILKFENFTYGVNIETGEIKWSTDLCQIYDINLKKCFYIGGSKFLKINPLNGQIEDESIIDTENFYPIRQIPRICNNLLITTDDKCKKLGAYDLLQKKFVWEYEILETTIYGDARFLITEEDRIYFLCANNNLKIFEKDLDEVS